MASLVVPLSRRKASDPSVAGGKGAGLARLTRAGFLVPPGFVVTTAAFREPLDSALAIISLEAARRFCLDWAMPEKLRRAILDAYHRLGAGPVAVRSSMVGEDAAAASFAGQLESVLDVTGDAALLEAVRRVLASAFGDRLWAYLRQPGLASPASPGAFERPLLLLPRSRRLLSPSSSNRWSGPRSRASPSASTPSPAVPGSSSRPPPAWARPSSRDGPAPTATASTRAASSTRPSPSGPARPSSTRPRPGRSAPSSTRSPPSPRSPRTSSGPSPTAASTSSRPAPFRRSSASPSTPAAWSPTWPPDWSSPWSGRRNTRRSSRTSSPRPSSASPGARASTTRRCRPGSTRGST